MNKEIITKIKNLPKVELHLHLDGSIPLKIASQLSGLPQDNLPEKMIATDKCHNLSEYLTKFDFPIELMQTKENLTLIAKSLADYLESENIIYAEIRFAPMFHTNKGLTYEEVIEAILEGLKNANVKTNLILCMMRGLPKENNLKTIEVASKYLNRGVCAIDLAGAEDKYPLAEYLELFQVAKSKHIPFTIHAGENGNATEVAKAIQAGAKRIGHGIHAIESDDVLKMLKVNNILLEICPTSNVQTNSVDIYANHSIKKLYQSDIDISINTDNKTVSNITLTEEYLKLYNQFNFNLDDFNTMNKNAIKHAFITETEKEELLAKLK